MATYDLASVPQITDIYLKIGENNWKKLFDLTSKIPPVTIELTLTNSEVIINGTTYTASTNITTTNPVNVIFTIYGNSQSPGLVTLNGTTIYQTKMTNTTISETFTWAPSENYNIITINCNTMSNGFLAATIVTITTT